MRQARKGRKWKNEAVAIYFAYLTDDDIQKLVNACEQELELRSQESMQAGLDTLPEGVKDE